MSGVLNAVETMLRRKEEALAEVAAIDAEIARVRAALGGRIPTPAKRNYKREIRLDDSSFPNKVHAALEAKEPRTLEDITAYIGSKSRESVRNYLNAMVMAGRLHRIRLTGAGQGRPHIYARTETALREFVTASPSTEQPSSEGDDELGRVRPGPSDAGTSSSVTDGSL
jgi:hypothetical protein